MDSLQRFAMLSTKLSYIEMESSNAHTLSNRYSRLFKDLGDWYEETIYLPKFIPESSNQTTKMFGSINLSYKTIFRHSLYPLSSESWNRCLLDMAINFLVPSTEDKPS
ncbi:hypothetical protein TNCV_1876131 [Trichonephila clavipes]|nr:hypothetical protein TNCV_1876131 [Trichonephila clavipes]